MRKLLFILLFLPFISKAQVKTKLYVGGPLATNVYRGPLGSDSALYIGSGCGDPNTIIPKANVGEFYKVYLGAMIYKDTCANSVWTTNPDSSWSELLGGDTSIIYISNDTTIVQNIIVKKALKVPLTDTTNAKKGCANLIYDTINEHFYGDVCLNGVHAYWGCFDCSASGGIHAIYAGYGLANVNDSTLRVDTSTISTKANVDSKTITLTQGTNISITGNATQNLGQNPSWTINATGVGSGTVTSVALSAPTIFTVSGSPVTTSGTLTFSPNNTTGDLIYGSGTNTLAYRAIGTSGQHLVVSGGLPVWRDTTAVPTSFVSSWSGGTTGMTPNTATTGAVTMAGVLVEANGGTHQSTYTTGDILYASASNTLSKLAIGTTGQHLQVVGGIPAWRDTTAAFAGYTFTNGLTLSGSNVRWKGTLLENTTITGAGFYSAFSGGRLEAGQGAAVTAANDLTLGADGNTFSITGATQINAITISNWQAGSVVNLIFASTPLVKNNTAGGAGTAPILLASSADFQAAANDVLTLVYDGSNWHETSRKQATTGGQFWALANGGTLTGANTITSSRLTGLTFTGTTTATGNSQDMFEFTPSLTARNTANDTFSIIKIVPALAWAANNQWGNALYINPTYTVGAFTTPQRNAIVHNGDIAPLTTNAWQIGKSGNLYSAGFFTTTNTNTVKQLSGNLLSLQNASGISMMTLNGGVATSRNTKISANVSAADSLYMLNVIGEIKSQGTMLIAQLPTPVINTVTPQGTTGATTYTYKIVFRDIGGTVSGASAAVSTTTGNATLTASNFNRIAWSNTEASSLNSYYVDIYRTVGGASQGKIGTVTGYNASSFDDNNLSATGDGTTAPADNTTGNIGVGILRPIGGVDIKASVRGDGGATMFLRSGVDSQTNKIAGQVNYDGTNIKLADGTYNYTMARTLTASATLDFGSTGAGAVADLTITVRGATDGDPVILGVPNGSVTATATFWAWVSAANTVTVRFSPKATEDPASGTFKVTVNKQ